MKESFKLSPGSIPIHLKLGEVSLRAPIRKSPEFPFGSIQIGVTPGSFRPGMLGVHISGASTPELIEIRRVDINQPENNLQVEVIREEAGGPVRRKILRQPISCLALIKTEDGWEAQAEGMEVLDESGLSILATVVTNYALNKQLRPRAHRPISVEAEL